jgi:hypothetical protein
MIPGTSSLSEVLPVGKEQLCTVRVPWKNGSTAAGRRPFPAFNTLYVLQQGFFQ